MLFKKRELVLLVFLLIFLFSINNVAAYPYYFEQIGQNYGNFPFFSSGFYSDPWQFYQQYPYWPDTIIIIVLFVVLMKALLEKNQALGERSSSVGGILGFFLGLSLSLYLNAINYHALADSGPLVVAAIVIYLVLLIYKWATGQKKWSMGAFIIGLILLLIVLSSFFPGLLDAIPFGRAMIPLLFLILIIGLLASLVGGIGSGSGGDSEGGKKWYKPWKWFNGKGKDGGTKDDGKDDEEKEEKPDVPKIKKVEIIIMPEAKNDIYVLNDPNKEINIYANVFEKKKFFSASVPFKNKLSDRNYVYQWEIGGVKLDNHNNQIKVSLNTHLRESPTKLPIVVTVKDSDNGSEFRASRMITLVGGSPNIDIVLPVNTNDTYTLNESTKSVSFRGNLNSMAYSDLKKLIWYVFPGRRNGISRS